MRVLIYVHSFSPCIGGTETHVMLLAKGLAAQWRDTAGTVTVATPTPAQGFDDHALPFHVVRTPRLLQLWRLIGQAEVVHLAGPVLIPLAFALLRRKPVVVAHHGYQVVCPNGLLLEEPAKNVCPGHFMARRYRACIRCNLAEVGWRQGLVRFGLTIPRRWLCRWATVHVAITAHVARRVALPRTRTIYHGVPDRQADVQPASGRKPAVPMLAYVGRLVSEKGLPLLLGAAKRLSDKPRDFKLKLVGDGPERPKLESMVDQLGLRERVAFTGWVRGAELEEALRDVIAVIMPSICEETAGLSAIEQMMCGRPIIAADIGGLAEVVGEGGLKFPPGDADSLASCLDRVLVDPDFGADLGRRARERAERLFGVDVMVRRYVDLYREAVLLAAADRRPTGLGPGDARRQPRLGAETRAIVVTPRRLAVVTPFVDKRHGTERCVAEQMERLVRDHGYELHIYSHRVRDIAVGDRRIVWHRIPEIPGPGILKYVWWFAANHLWRWWDTRVARIGYDLVYSPGINCVDADAVAVHIVFAEFLKRLGPDLAFQRHPLASWPRLVHRRLYYWLIGELERRIYSRPTLALAAVSHKTGRELARFRGRKSDVRVVYNAVDAERFSPSVRERLRASARRHLKFSDDAFGLLFVGNDWKTKGLPALLEAVRRIGDSNLQVMIVGNDDRALFEAHTRSLRLETQVWFLSPRSDIEYYYAAADAYVGPSLYDSFALPPLEAMACGLPVIVSTQNGGSEIVTDGVDGLILSNPSDTAELARLIGCLLESVTLRHRLGGQAVRTAQKYTWDRNATETAAFLENAMKLRGRA